MKDQKRFAALALSAVMVFSMAGSVSAAQKVVIHSQTSYIFLTGPPDAGPEAHC